MKRFLRTATTVAYCSSFLWRRSATFASLFSITTITTLSSSASTMTDITPRIRFQRQQSTNLNTAESIPTTEPNNNNNNNNKNMVPELDEFTKKIANRLLSGDRSALSKAITIVESKRYEDHLRAQALLSYVTSQFKKQRSSSDADSDRYNPSLDRESFRIGISGPPGAGKSTFIECIGKLLVQQGHKIAVLAVDPSSRRTGGSILGDKTRMTELAKSEHAYIRPSPSQGFLGGVTANMYEIITLCECAGYDRILIETVGVGQSETQIADLTDIVLLLVPPSGGDELQGIKRGIVEVADLIVVNKTDGSLIPVAKRTQREYRNALHLLAPRDIISEDGAVPETVANLQTWKPQVLCCSSAAQTNFGSESTSEEAAKYSVRNVLDKIEEYRRIQHENGHWYYRRREQRKDWLWKQVSEDLVTRLLHHSDKLKAMVKDLQNKVSDGKISPRVASELILKEFVAEQMAKNSQ
jgi:LAO/AO transport system kinase